VTSTAGRAKTGSEPGALAAGAALGADPLPGLVPGSSRQNSVYRRMMAACDKLASAAVQGADAVELTRVFAETAGKTVILLDPELRPQAQAASTGSAETTDGWDPGDASIKRLLRVLTAERRPLRVPPIPGSALARGCLATPVIVGDTILGYLLVLDETAADADDVDLIVATYAATLFALTLARTQTSLELALRYREAMVDSLVSGHFLDNQDARGKARALGVADGQPFRVAVVRVSAAATSQPPRPGEQDLAGALLACLAGSGQGAAAIRGPELVMLLPEQDTASPSGRSTAATGTMGARPELVFREADVGPVTCGLSELTRWPEMAPQALRQAQHAIDLGLRLGRAGQTICYEELGIYRLLLQVGDMHQLWQFAQDVLGPLLDYDARHKVNLVGTLSVYLNQHESLKQTARVLRVHVNTVTYRIQRIEQLTSLDLTNPDHRLSAHVATKIIESQQHPHLPWAGVPEALPAGHRARRHAKARGPVPPGARRGQNTADWAQQVHRRDWTRC
jgi:sugar diacid utilization regulator